MPKKFKKKSRKRKVNGYYFDGKKLIILYEKKKIEKDLTRYVK